MRGPVHTALQLAGGRQIVGNADSQALAINRRP
jgi:hypothetical protein